MILKPIKVAASLTTVLILQGCSGSHQDPRISLCRHLASDMSNTADDSVWSTNGEDIVRPEYAKVKVKTIEGQNASCFYEYDAVEEDALTHSDPLSAYATLPYKMVLNGKEISAQKLKAAVMAQQTKTGKAIINKAQQAIESANKHIQESLENIHKN